MTLPTVDPLVSLSISASVALLFAFGALHKLRDWDRFRAAVAGYRLAPATWSQTLALMVIIAELGVVVGLVVSRTAALVLAAMLLLAYAAAMAINIAKGRKRIDCGCLGFGHQERIEWSMVRRNLFIAAIALCAALPLSSRPLSIGDVMVAILASLTAAVLYIAHGILTANRQRSELQA
jgi:hypothetical protein